MGHCGMTLFENVERRLAWVEKAVAYLAGFGILALMLYGCVSVFARKLLNMPIHGVSDISEVTMVAVALFGISYCQREHGNVRMTLLTSRFPPRIATIADIVATAIAILFIALITFGAWRHAASYWELGGGTYELNIPLWIVAVMVPFSCAVLLMRLIVQLSEAVPRLFSASNRTSPHSLIITEAPSQDLRND